MLQVIQRRHRRWIPEPVPPVSVKHGKSRSSRAGRDFPEVPRREPDSTTGPRRGHAILNPVVSRAGIGLKQRVSFGNRPVNEADPFIEAILVIYVAWLEERGDPIAKILGSQSSVEKLSTDPSIEAKLSMSLAELKLSARAISRLETYGIATVRDLVVHSDEELLGIRGFGETTLKAVKSKLQECGLHLGMNASQVMGRLERFISNWNALYQIDPVLAASVLSRRLLLGQEQAGFRCWTAETLMKMGPAERAVAPVLVDTLKECGTTTGYFASIAQALVGIDPEAGVAFLTEALQSHSRP